MLNGEPDRPAITDDVAAPQLTADLASIFLRLHRVFKKRFGLPPWPERWPEKPPPDWEHFFCVDIAVKDAAGAEFDVRVPYKRFAENRNWAKALDLNVAEFCASEAMWRYNDPTYRNEHLQFATYGGKG